MVRSFSKSSHIFVTFAYFSSLKGNLTTYHLIPKRSISPISLRDGQASTTYTFVILQHISSLVNWVPKFQIPQNPPCTLYHGIWRGFFLYSSPSTSPLKYRAQCTHTKSASSKAYCSPSIEFQWQIHPFPIIIHFWFRIQQWLCSGKVGGITGTCTLLPFLSQVCFGCTEYMWLALALGKPRAAEKKISSKI